MWGAHWHYRWITRRWQRWRRWRWRITNEAIAIQPRSTGAIEAPLRVCTMGKRVASVRPHHTLIYVRATRPRRETVPGKSDVAAAAVAARAVIAAGIRMTIVQRCIGTLVDV